jgi:hypothetical protein
MDVKKAALMAGVAVLASGVGMIFGGRSGRPAQRQEAAASGPGAGLYSVLPVLVLIAAFALPPSPVGLGLTFIGRIVRRRALTKQFERFVKWLLMNDPEWATQVRRFGYGTNIPVGGGPIAGLILSRKQAGKKIGSPGEKLFCRLRNLKNDVDTFLSESKHQQQTCASRR